MLNKIKIGPKLIVGFLLVALIAGFIGIFGIVQMKTIDDADTRLYKNITVPISELGAIVSAFHQTRTDVRDMIRSNNSDEIRQKAANIDEQLAIITENTQSYEKTIYTEVGRKLFDEFRAVHKEYLTHLERLKELAKENRDAEAWALVDGHAAATAKAEQDAIEKMVEAKVNLGKKTAEENTATYISSRNVMLLILVIGVMAAILLGVFLTMSITRPLSTVVTMIQRMGKGLLGMRLKMNRQDEIGVLAATMDQFAEDLQTIVVGTMKKIADGDLSTEVQPKDPQDEIAPALKKTIDSLRGLIAEAAMLRKAAVEGKLATRGQADKFKGAYRDIIQGVNDTLDAVIGPLNVAAEYVDRISKGDIPKPITDNYNGDFNEIKNNLNRCIEAVNLMVSDALMLAQAAVEGKLATRADAGKHQGDFAKIVKGVNDTLDAVIGPINEAASVLEKVAARDMTARVKGDYKGDLAKIKNALNTAVDNLDQALIQVAEATEQVSSASQQIASGSQTLSQGASEQASSLEEVSSSLEEMASMTKQNAENAHQAKNLAAEANDNAKNGTEAMSRMSQAISRIKESSDQTAKIVKTIDEIAIQTNLLALNAAVEAARAGDAGRGFAVVAEEVRNLAQRSSQAAKNTADMIGESVKNAEDGVKISAEVSKAFEAIVESAKKVNDLIAEITAACSEQSQGIEQVNTAVAQLDKVTQSNAANAEESASAAEELSSQAEQLQHMVTQFVISQVVQKKTATAASSHPVHAMKVAATGAYTPIHSGDNLRHSKPLHGGPARNRGKSVSVKPEEVIPLEESVLKEF